MILSQGDSQVQVFHVFQIVIPGHRTSYRTGKNWISSHDGESEANENADVMNSHVVSNCGVSYAVEGPCDEMTEVNDVCE